MVDLPKYETPLMQIMNDIINEFWLDYTDDKIPTKQDFIVQWAIEKYGISYNIALSIDRVVRPPIAKQGKARKL